MQRIEDGNVSFVLEFACAEYKRQVAAVCVGVKRTNETSNSERSVGCIPIKQTDLAHVQETKVILEINQLIFLLFADVTEETVSLMATPLTSLMATPLTSLIATPLTVKVGFEDNKLLIVFSS